MAKKTDQEWIQEIAKRARKQALDAGLEVRHIDVMMAVTLVHKKTPLRLAELSDADDFNFNHDVFGILRHIDKDTGDLLDCFFPRFAAKV